MAVPQALDSGVSPRRAPKSDAIGGYNAYHGHTMAADAAAGSGGYEHHYPSKQHKQDDCCPLTPPLSTRTVGSDASSAVYRNGQYTASPMRKSSQRTSASRQYDEKSQRASRSSSEGAVKRSASKSGGSGGGGGRDHRESRPMTATKMLQQSLRRPNRPFAVLHERPVALHSDCGGQDLTPPSTARRSCSSSAGGATTSSGAGRSSPTGNVVQESESCQAAESSSPSRRHRSEKVDDPRANGSSTPRKVVSNKEKEIYEEVSSLVEELQAARARALASGGKPPRAVEAAASALEPLLRLRDVTGAFACDLTLMPWLPQLLAVFRNVLHTAVDGVNGSVPSTPKALHSHRQQPFQGSGADSGAGEAADPPNSAAAAAAAAAAALQSLSVVGGGAASGCADGGAAALASASMMIECETFRERIRQQDVAIEEYRQRERRMMRELQELRRERDELQQRVSDLEPQTLSGFGTSTPRSMADGCSSSSLATTSDLDAQSLAKRVTELETEKSAWRYERRTAEEQIGDLLALASAALEDTSRERERERELEKEKKQETAVYPRARSQGSRRSTSQVKTKRKESSTPGRTGYDGDASVTLENSVVL